MKKLFLGIFIVLFSVLILTGCDFESTATTSAEEDKTSSDKEDSGTSSNVKEIPNYKINDNIYVTNSSGKYRFKITGVKETEERNQFSDTQAKKVIVISYEYENQTLQNNLYISSMDFKAYDKDDYILETYEVINYKYPSSVSTGHKETAEMVFALNNDINYIELEYYDNFFNSKPDCKIILEW